MGFTTGKVSFTRHFILGLKPTGAQGLAESLPALFERFVGSTITPIGLKEDKEQSAGWAHPFTGDPLTDEVSVFDLVFGPVLMVGLRIDTKTLPGTMFRLQMRNALASLMDSAGSTPGGDMPRKVPKRLKDAVRDRVRVELMQNTLPKIQLLNVALHLDTGELWVDTTSKACLQTLERVWVETFGSALLEGHAGILAITTADGGGSLGGTATQHRALGFALNMVPMDLLTQDDAEATTPVPQDFPTPWREFCRAEADVVTDMEAFSQGARVVGHNRAFLAREFLTHTALMVSQPNIQALLPADLQGVLVAVDGRVDLSRNSGAVNDTKLKGAAPTQSQAFARAVGTGHVVTKLKLLFQEGDRQWGCVLDDSMRLTGVSVPPVSEPDAVAHCTARIDHLTRLVDWIDALYANYLAHRLQEPYLALIREQMTLWSSRGTESVL